MSIFKNITEGYVKIIINTNLSFYLRYYNNNKQMLFSYLNITLKLPHTTTNLEFNNQFNQFINNIKNYYHVKHISKNYTIR